MLNINRLYSMRKRINKIEVNRISELGEDGMFVKQLDGSSDVEVRTALHRDDYYMFGFLFSGSLTISIDFKEFKLTAGDLILTTPGQVHKISSIDNKSSGCMLALSPEFLSDTEIELINRYALVAKAIRLDDETMNDIAMLFEIMQRRGLTSISKTIVSLAVQSIGNIPIVETCRYTSIFTKFKTSLDRNINKIKGASAYAAMLNISEVYLNEAVKATTGHSVSRFIMSQVVLYAKRLFANTDMTAQQIASNLGYVDYPYFSRLFKKIEGISPAEYRRNLK